jgi:hypothetical protein
MLLRWLVPLSLAVVIVPPGCADHMADTFPPATAFRPSWWTAGRGGPCIDHRDGGSCTAMSPPHSPACSIRHRRGGRTHSRYQSPAGWRFLVIVSLQRLRDFLMQAFWLGAACGPSMLSKILRCGIQAPPPMASTQEPAEGHWAASRTGGDLVAVPGRPGGHGDCHRRCMSPAIEDRAVKPLPITRRRYQVP